MADFYKNDEEIFQFADKGIITETGFSFHAKTSDGFSFQNDPNKKQSLECISSDFVGSRPLSILGYDDYIKRIHLSFNYSKNTWLPDEEVHFSRCWLELFTPSGTPLIWLPFQFDPLFDITNEDPNAGSYDQTSSYGKLKLLLGSIRFEIYARWFDSTGWINYTEVNASLTFDYRARTPTISSPRVHSSDTTLGNTTIVDASPVFSAIFSDPNTLDESYTVDIQVSTSPTFATITHWDGSLIPLTATCAKDTRCADINYAGSTLSSGTTYYYRIRFYDSTDLASPWANGNFITSHSSVSASSNPYGQGFRVWEDSNIKFDLHEGDFNYLSPTQPVEGKSPNIVCLPDGSLRLVCIGDDNQRHSYISRNDGETWQEE